MKETACIKCNGICNACCYSDYCNRFNDIEPYNAPLIEASEVCMVLCEGRHKTPQAKDGAIFDTQINPLETGKLEQEAKNKLTGIKTLNLYVTGLTVALVAVLNACKTLDIKVTLFHFDRVSGNYYKQEVK